MKHTSIKGSLPAVLALAVLSMAGLTQPAMADDHHRGPPPRAIHRGDEWRHHEDDAYRWHHDHPVYEPGVVYAPPAVVYSQPEPSPGINLIVPLHIR